MAYEYFWDEDEEEFIGSVTFDPSLYPPQAGYSWRIGNVANCNPGPYTAMRFSSPGEAISYFFEVLPFNYCMPISAHSFNFDRPANTSPPPSLYAVTIWACTLSPPMICGGRGNASYIINFFRTTDAVTDSSEVKPVNTGVLAPATDAQVNTALSDAQLQQLISEAIRQGYATPEVWPELADAIEELNDLLDSESVNYDAGLDAQTRSGTTTYSGTSTATATAGGMSAEWPGFCDWAGVVCDFLDWFTADVEPPEDPEFPEEEVDDYDVVTVGGGSYSCPGPTMLGTALGQPLEFSWAPACNFAVAANPVILLGLLVVAVSILAGVGLRGGA